MEPARRAMASGTTLKGANATRKPGEAGATVLVASDSPSDAALVKKLLAPEYDQVFISTDSDLAVEDFENHTPDVLVLAFNAMGKSEGYYLGLFRRSSKIHLQSHRTVILCNKDEVNRAYQACRKEYFDDYILFWPMTNDATRLLMSVHHALRDLAVSRDGGPSPAEFAAQARRLAELGSMLDQQLVQGSQRIEVVSRTILQAEQEIGVALDGFSKTLEQGKLTDVPRITDVAGLEREIKRLKQEEIRQRFRAATESVEPIKRWAAEFRKECEPHIESARSLNALADRIRPTILIVDDDDFQCKVVSQLLAAENFRLVFALGGVEALNILRKMQPDLILMDIMMPDLGGIETTRRIKTMPPFANVPVIMITGNSEGATVRDSMKAGAVDFVVKPFDRETLIAKMVRALGTTVASSAVRM